MIKSNQVHDSRHELGPCEDVKWKMAGGRMDRQTDGDGLLTNPVDVFPFPTPGTKVEKQWVGLIVLVAVTAARVSERVSWVNMILY